MFIGKGIEMIQSRFATYYENHPESNDVSKILKTSNENIKSAINPAIPSKKAIDLEKKLRNEQYAYLEKSIKMKIELALMYISRSHSYLQGL